LKERGVALAHCGERKIRHHVLAPVLAEAGTQRWISEQLQRTLRI